MRKGAIKNLTNQKFGRLTVVEITNERTSGRHVVWKCICDCGNECYVNAASLTSGKTKSCGCLAKESRGTSRITHHKSNEKIYRVWQSMKDRCNRKKNKNYPHYGGRGLKVFSEWEDDFQTFYDWALANGYKEGSQIDRVDVNGNYEPSNCRWVNVKMQQNNKRNNHLITYRGITHTITEWEDLLGFKRGVISSRINRYKWDVERALTEGATDAVHLFGVFICDECLDDARRWID